MTYVRDPLDTDYGPADDVKLTMLEWLRAVRDHDLFAREHLLGMGFPSKVIVAKSEKSARKNYTDYGTVSDRAWLTERGRNFLGGDE